jgi:hypothetical protein
VEKLTAKKVLAGIWIVSLVLLVSTVIWFLTFCVELFLIGAGFEMVTPLAAVGLFVTTIILLLRRKAITRIMPKGDFAASALIVATLTFAIAFAYCIWAITPSLLWYW